MRPSWLQASSPFVVPCRALAVLLLMSAVLPGQTDPAPATPPVVDEADAALQRLKQSLEAEPGLSAETKAAMAAFFDALAGDVQRRAELEALDLAALQRLAAAPPTTPGRWEKLKEQLTLYGDIRLREEYSFDLDDQPSRDRTRLRLRLGANYVVDENWSVGARLRTGDPEDPNSPHNTLDDAFDSYDFTLDRAFLAYRAECLDGVKLTGGKFDHPFYANPVYGELVWDEDVNPEGVVAGYTVAGDDPAEKLEFALGYYMTVERGGGTDSSMNVAQVAGTAKLGDTTKGTLAVGYYDYNGLTPDGTQALVSDNPSQTSGGNAVIDTNADGTPDEFVSDFQIWNPIASLTLEGWSTPVVFSGEYIKNSGAHDSPTDDDLDSGYAFGVGVGQQKKKGDWLGYYQWQRVEQDAVFAAFAQDDFLLAANQTGHVFGTRYRITDVVGAHLWALVSARDAESVGATTDSRSEQWRVRLDFDVRF